MVTTINTGALQTGDGSGAVKGGSNLGVYLFVGAVALVAAYFGYEYYQNQQKMKDLQNENERSTV